MSHDSCLSKDEALFSSGASQSHEVPLIMTISQAKSALNEVITALNHPNNLAKMNAARNGKRIGQEHGYEYGEHAQLDMIRHMTYVFPVMTEVLTEVVAKYGFVSNGQGVIQFILTVKDMARHDADLESLYNTLKNNFLVKLN
jgi:hypothetical protein